MRPSSTRAWFAIVGVLILLVLMLTGCADLDQAATTPGLSWRGTVVQGISVPATPGASPSATPKPYHEIAGPVAVPNRRRIYFTQGGDLWQLPIDNAAAPVIQGREILAYAPAPDGERVAVAYQTSQDPNQPASGEFAIVNADSTTELTLNAPPDASSSQQLVRSIAWSPEGLSIAVARQDGSIIVIAADGSVHQVVPPRPDSAPGELEWSPDGTMLLYLDPALPSQATNLYTVSVAGGERHRVVESSSPEDAVIAATWLPGRDMVAYVIASPTTISRGGDVFAVHPDGTGTTLLLSAGQFAPVAGVVDIAASPDGRYLAATIYVPSVDGSSGGSVYQSLRIIDLTTRATKQIDTARGEAVTDLWWASGQLIYRSVPQSRAVVPGVYTGIEPFALYQVDLASKDVQERYRP